MSADRPDTGILATANDAKREEIVESLREDIQEELGHATQYANRIKELYGVVPGSMRFSAEQSYLQPPEQQTDIVHVIPPRRGRPPPPLRGLPARVRSRGPGLSVARQTGSASPGPAVLPIRPSTLGADQQNQAIFEVHSQSRPPF